MVVFTPRPEQLVDILPLPVGVFEDDALLLRLSARSRLMSTWSPRTCVPINSDDLALENARRADSATWDL